MRNSGMLCVILAGAMLPLAVSGQERIKTVEQLRRLRDRLVRRPRRIVFNNDGCDCLYFPRKLDPTPENFLAQRTSALAGTQVDTISYCTISSGFSNFTHRTSVGAILELSPSDFGIQPAMQNIARDLINQGTDPLRLVTDFGHQHGMEVFWSMRMNDTHDAAHTPEKPYFLFPKLKEEHPEWLVGNHTQKTPRGRWSSVNYAVPEVRDLALRFIEEVCTNYDIDGIELDFFRHLCYFPSVANGGAASPEELGLMSELIQRIRTMTETVGLKRGRPILVAVRVPDSVGFNREMGLDVEQWLSRGLVDMLVTTCYFRLNPWQTTADLAHRYNVAAYACLSDSRVRGESRFRRGSLESARGRAVNAWASGVDGIHIFNAFNPKSPIWSQLGDPESLQGKNKLFFVAVRDGDPDRYLAGGKAHRTIPVLTPGQPGTITPEAALETDIFIGEDFAKGEASKRAATVTCHLELPTIDDPSHVEVTLNGKGLSGGLLVDGWLDMPVSPEDIRVGNNALRVALAPVTDTRNPADWTLAYEHPGKPGTPWSRDRGSKRTEEKRTDEGLYLADNGTVSGDYLYYRYPWGADAGAGFSAEARVRAVSGSSYLIFSDGVGGERLGIWPDRIELFHQKQVRYDMDTTSALHTYRVIVQGTRLQVLVDGVLRMDLPRGFPPRSMYSRNELAFGAANSTMMGVGVWQSVRARVTGRACRDIVFSVNYEAPK